MARAAQTLNAAPKRDLDADQMRAGIVRLGRRLEELQEFDASRMQDRSPPELAALSAGILSGLAKTFGDDTAEYRRFAHAADLSWHPAAFIAGRPTPLSDYQKAVGDRVNNARVLLAEAIKGLNEDLEEIDVHIRPASTRQEMQKKAERSNKVFVVHGHDDGAREAVARFLGQIGFEPIILHEHANQGRTIIEKIEAHGEADFAVVLLTPDDEGRARGGALEPRARQNVLLELGYFIGRLGRANVCALKRGHVEIPSDFAGVVWEEMTSGSGWKQALGRELEAAGHAIDWNRVMRS